MVHESFLKHFLLLVYQSGLLRSFQTRTKCGTRGYRLLRTGSLLTVLGSELIDTDLGIVYSKTGLYDATADKFAKTIKVKTTNEDKINNKTQIKHTNNSKQNDIPSCDIWEKSLRSRSLIECSWMRFTRTKLFNFIQKQAEFYHYTVDLDNPTGVG